MKNLNMETAIKRYNKIMNMCGYEHKTIGEPLSEGTENWTISDMVLECQYVLSTFFESGHCNEEMRRSEFPEERKEWRREVGLLDRFIKTYKPFTKDVTSVHKYICF